MVVKRVGIERIKTAPWNPRQDLQPGAPVYEKLRRSMDEFGLVEPLIWNERTGYLVGGHQRFKIMVAAGAKEVEVVVVDLPPERERALNIALNKVHGEWDEPKLAALFEELAAIPEFDIQLTGFDIPEVNELLSRMGAAALADRDEDFDVEGALDAKGEPVTRPGELLEFGPHRVLCGDARNGDDIRLLMGAELAQMVFTDPPYGVNYIGGRAGRGGRQRLRRDGERYWDRLTPAQYLDLLKRALSNARDFSDDKTPLYLWFASVRIREVLKAFDDTGWTERNLIIWVKDRFAGSLYAQYKHGFEPFFYAHKRGEAPRWSGPTNESTVWEHDRPSRSEGHPTIKPVELAVRAINNSSRPGQVVLDLFLGSGTTLIAAAKTGRRCFGTEIDPRYVDLIVRRYIALVGEKEVDPALAERYRVKEGK